MDEINKSLGYKPTIEYEDEYYSERHYRESSSIVIVPEDTKDKEDISDLIDKVETNLFGLPEYIQVVINNVFDPIKDFFDENKDDIDSGSSKPGDDIINPGGGDGGDFNPGDEDNNDNDGNDPDEEIPEGGGDLPSDDEEDDMFEPLVHIVDNELSILEQINRGYSDHFYDLLKDYLEKLYESLSNYWTVVVPLLYGKPADMKKFMTSDLPKDFKTTADKQHILDFAVRSQLMKYEKVSFVNKNFSLDESLVKLRQFKSSHELMLRYATTEYKDIYTKEGSDHNAILEACMLNYNRKYNNSVINLYKYLDSSVKTVDNALTTYAQEMKCKQYLK